MKTSRTVPKLPLLRKTINIRKILNLRKALDLRKTFAIYTIFNIRKTLDIRKVLLPLGGRSRTYRVSKGREDKADGPVLDAEEVTISPSTNVKA